MSKERVKIPWGVLGDIVNAPRIWVMEDPKGIPDREGLNKAFLGAKIPCLLLSNTPHEMRPPRDKVSQFLEILPQYGFKPLMAGNL